MSRTTRQRRVALCALSAAVFCLPYADTASAAPRKQDRTKPVVAFEAPTAGTSVSGSLSGGACEASARDNFGVDRVEFSVDGAALNVDRGAPYTCAWDTTGAASGQHKVTARAVDTSGNAATTDVTVSIVASEPTPAPTPTPTPTPIPAPTSGPCASSTPNVADGPDPAGGCLPGPSNTGPTGTLAAYTGSCKITTANTVIDSKTVDCDLTVQASGLIIRNSRVNGSVLQPDGVSASFTITDSLIDGHDPYACINCGVGYRNFTITRTEITGTNRGAYCEKTCRIEDSWVHGTDLEPVASNLAHASAVRVEQGATLIHNTLACDYHGPFPNGEIGCSADISGYPDFAPINRNTIVSNLLVANNDGIGFCDYGGGTAGKPFSGDPTNATYIVFRNNVFQRGANGKCGTYGPITDFITDRTGNEWTGNVWDSGELVRPG
jgi:hypothetical protein